MLFFRGVYVSTGGEVQPRSSQVLLVFREDGFISQLCWGGKESGASQSNMAGRGLGMFMTTFGDG